MCLFLCRFPLQKIHDMSIKQGLELKVRVKPGESGDRWVLLRCSRWECPAHFTQQSWFSYLSGSSESSSCSILSFPHLSQFCHQHRSWSWEHRHAPQPPVRLQHHRLQLFIRGKLGWRDPRIKLPFQTWRRMQGLYEDVWRLKNVDTNTQYTLKRFGWFKKQGFYTLT